MNTAGSSTIVVTPSSIVQTASSLCGEALGDEFEASPRSPQLHVSKGVATPLSVQPDRSLVNFLLVCPALIAMKRPTNFYPLLCLLGILPTSPPPRDDILALLKVLATPLPSVPNRKRSGCRCAL